MKRLALGLALLLSLAVAPSAMAQTVGEQVLGSTVDIPHTYTLTAALNTGSLAAGTYLVWASGHVAGPAGDEIECQIRSALGAGGFTGAADNRVIPSSGETALSLVPKKVTSAVATTYTLYCLDETSTSGVIEPVDTHLDWLGPL